MSLAQPPTVWAFPVFTDPDYNGVEFTGRFTFLTEDHAEAAQRAFEYVARGSKARVREVLTFDGEPRRWTGDYTVTEVGVDA